MTDKIKDGGPAFPNVPTEVCLSHDWDTGMSLRDWFAGMALQGQLAKYGIGLPKTKDDIPYRVRIAAEYSYKLADEMIKQRSENK